MSIRYVGKGGSDANNGLTWSTRKLTLNGAEDTPVAPGDIVYVGAGTYRELLTVDVSGTFGNQISYIGDYTGQNTDGIGGVVRVTGSDNDQTATRSGCIAAVSKSYRTFTGFAFDISASVIADITTSTDVIFDKCIFYHGVNTCIRSIGLTQARLTVRNCAFFSNRAIAGIQYTHSAVVDNAAHVVENCLFIVGASANSITTTRVGGITVKNSTFWAGGSGVAVSIAVTVGQTVTVNNCLFQALNTALVATVSGEIVENYNSFFGNGTDRSNTATGANSISYPALFDSRWFFQLVNAGAGPYNPTQFATPYDLSAQSQIINVTGTNPTSTDMRGTAIQGSQRELGALEPDPTLSIKARQASSIDGGGMVV